MLTYTNFLPLAMSFFLFGRSLKTLDVCNCSKTRCNPFWRIFCVEDLKVITPYVVNIAIFFLFQEVSVAGILTQKGVLPEQAGGSVEILVIMELAHHGDGLCCMCIFYVPTTYKMHISV